MLLIFLKKLVIQRSSQGKCINEITYLHKSTLFSVTGILTVSFASQNQTTRFLIG